MQLGKMHPSEIHRGSVVDFQLLAHLLIFAVCDVNVKNRYK